MFYLFAIIQTIFQTNLCSRRFMEYINGTIERYLCVMFFSLIKKVVLENKN